MVDLRTLAPSASDSAVPLVLQGAGPALAGDVQNVLVGETVIVPVQEVDRVEVEVEDLLLFRPRVMTVAERFGRVFPNDLTVIILVDAGYFSTQSKGKNNV